MEDFEYLYQILKDNYPLFEVTKRIEGYDWLAQKADFETLIREAETNEDFAKAINKIVTSLNNLHSHPVSGGMVSYDQSSGPFAKAANMTTPEVADYWYGLMSKRPEPIRYFPFVAVYTAGEYVVAEVAPFPEVQAKVAPGMRVLKVNDLDVHDYARSRRGDTFLSFDPLRKRLYTPSLFLRSTNETLSVVLQDTSGSLAEMVLPYVSSWQGSYQRLPVWQSGSNTTKNVYTGVLVGGEVGYVHIRSLTTYDTPSAKEDGALLRKFFESIKDLPALIIDIRNNGGGDERYYAAYIVGALSPGPVATTRRSVARTGDYVRAFGSGGVEVSKDKLRASLNGEVLKKMPPEIFTGAFENPTESPYVVSPVRSIGYTGRVFLLTNDVVCSSSEGFAQFCQFTHWATLVGGYTAGDGGGGRALNLTLPNSGIPIWFRGFMTLKQDWTSDVETHTIPDVLVEQSYEDLMKYLDLVKSGKVLSGPDPECDTVLREGLRLAVESK